MSVMPPNSRFPLTWDETRERVVSDFRDFRFTWGGFFRWTGTVLAAFLVALLITLYFLDWNQMRGPVGRYLSHRTGREVRIDGNLAVKLFTWQPRIDVGGLYVGNPGWLKRDHAATVKQARVELRLMPLLAGNLILPLVSIDQADVLLVRDKDGRTNWDSNNQSANNEALKLPPIQRFLVSQGHVRIEDAVRKLNFTGTVTSEELRGGGNRAAFTLTGDGTLNQNKFLADVKGGPLLNIDQSRPYDFNADVKAGDTHVQVNGAITQPFHFDRFTATLNVTGPNLSDLYYLTGLTLPGSPPYHLTVAVQREDMLYRLNDIRATLGSTDLAGNLLVDTSNKLPSLAGKIASRSLNFADLGAVIRGGQPAPVQAKFMIPDQVLHTERLRQMNAEVDYSATSIKSRDFPLTSLDTHISLQSGVLNLKPLAFGFTQGKLSGSLKIDARKTVPVTAMDARITDVHAENFIKGSDKPIQGVLEARAQLTGTGSSAHQVAATANGTVTAVVPQGGMRHSLAEWMGVDVLDALSLNLSSDNSNTQLRCAVTSFGAKDGVLTSQQFVLDTDPVRVDGSGSINLRDETLDLKLQGKPKSFQLVRIRAPITVTGAMAKPHIGIDTKPLLVQGGIALALGVVNPLAAILAFVDPGLAKDANCGPLLADAKAHGNPVKNSAVQRAKAPRK
jgi:uncharacterized protein involved in outer membrane biogenesis